MGQILLGSAVTFVRSRRSETGNCARCADDTRDEQRELRRHRPGHELGLIGVPTAGLETVDLLHAEDVGIELADCGYQILVPVWQSYEVVLAEVRRVIGRTSHGLAMQDVKRRQPHCLTLRRRLPGRWPLRRCPTALSRYDAGPYGAVLPR